MSTSTVAAAPRQRRPLGSATALVAAGLLLPACSGSADAAAAAGDAVSSFQQALGTDPAKACELLAPATAHELESSSGTKCPVALQDAGLPAGGAPQRTVVAGHSAQVVLDTDTVFLALFDDGWRVTAAGCERPADAALPYDCIVQGA